MLHRETVMDVLRAALAAADPYKATLDALRSQLAKSEPGGRIYVVGAGKAGAAMARAAEEAAGSRIEQGLVVVKQGHTATGGEPLQKIRVTEASHPVPDSRAVQASSELLDIASRAREGDLVLCLISGGGSSLITSPAESISLQDIQIVTQVLLRAGATINELNSVRKHLSNIAGGQLARRATQGGARVLSLILSDVVGSPLDVIASGPTAPDPTTYADALGVLESYNLLYAVPPAVLERLEAGEQGELPDNPKPDDPVFRSVTNLIIASNLTALEAAVEQARSLGLDTQILSTFVEGEARHVGQVLAGIAKEIAHHNRPLKRPACALFGGETTVTVRGSGTGGRNSELALSAALALQGEGPDLVLAALATDGGDGPSPGAGAVADGTTIDRGKARGLDPLAALADNDTYPFWKALGDAIETGPTGTNVNDIVVVFVF